ncbi:MAG: lipid-binding SYLF domain-containing protein [Christiangramia sp.]|uniref:Uncharacterized protein n=1 Tax=Christiangramia flava JLT2011 TaxID=1229726 RepID=A0A1L7I597_9FLAO|nr:lipid-binding SYLF domain-containing protein [Christiangramia flava]APU68285.1 hypothetical protein GRFL_1561 [Christiangramia flava JLT2011]OSS40927.1 hypothetical protein C723_0336 [Christiangramia flava JLT2011]
MKMRKGAFLLLLAAGMLSNVNVNAQSDMEDQKTDEQVVDHDKKAKLIEDAELASELFVENSTNLSELMDKAAGYVIFPNVGKGAYILGGAAGNGVLFENGKVAGFAEMRQLDVGLQIGGQAYRQIILFQTENELNKFKEGNYKLSGNASAVVINKGKAKAVEFNNGRAIATMPKAGAMVEVSVGGQKFDYSDQ